MHATLGFGLTGLVVAVVLAAMTYAVARGYLVAQREDAALRQAYVNARLARTVLRSSQPDVRSLLTSLGGSASTTIINYGSEWFSGSVTVGRDAVPAHLLGAVGEGKVGHQRYRDPDGRLHVAVGVPIPAIDAQYFELFPLAELERTLELLARALAVGAGGASLAAALVGFAAGRELVRPLRPVADAAARIAGGNLDTRLGPERDPDLRRLVEAFNAMASALEERIEREARFAADVSHELRTPLAALAAAVQVIDRRRAQLPEQVLAAFEVLAAKVESFQQMVLDLLEISKIDAGTAPLELDSVDLGHLLARIAEVHGRPDVVVELAEGMPSHVAVDRRRLAQALGNIAENARLYAGGLARVCAEPAGDGLIRIVMDDRGPGVPPEEREAIFDRFSRGEAGLRAGTTTGSGLGLALAAEHVRLHGGRAWVEDAPAGGARFVVELPEARA